jgi:hypothetical protein
VSSVVESVNADHDRALNSLRSLKRLLDEAFRVPGTNIRFGWDPIIGLVPWVGDFLTALFSCAIIVQAHRMRLPGVVVVRMMLNVAIDVVIGVVPLVGDAADVFWKSNTMNFAILEQHAAEVRPASRGDWLFVVGIIGTVLAMAIVPLIVLYWLVHLIVGRAS